MIEFPSPLFPIPIVNPQWRDMQGGKRNHSIE
jgi:hypothetical protein